MQLRRHRRQVGPRQGQPHRQPDADAEEQPRPERPRLAPPLHEQQGEHRKRGQQDAQRPDPDQHGQPEREPAEPGQRKPAAKHPERVDEQAEPAEEQHLDQRLGERRPRHVELGQGHREHQRPDRRPPRPGQPSHQAAERQHRAAAEDRRHHQRAAKPGEPRPGGEHQRQPRQERWGEGPARGVEPGAAEDQPAGRPERRRRRRYPRRSVLGDPVPVLQVDARVADREDLLGPEQRLPDPEPGRDRDRGDQRADRHVGPPPGGGRGVKNRVRLAIHVRLAELRPARRQLSHREVAERQRERHEDDHHRHRQQAPGQQHPRPRHQPRDRQQGRRHRDRPEQPPGQPPPPLGQLPAPLGGLLVRPVKRKESLGDGPRPAERRPPLLCPGIPNGTVAPPGSVSFPSHRA